VALALEVQDRLAAQGLEMAVVSLPCWHAFFQQEPAWRELVLGHAPRIGLEPGGGFGWGALLGQDGLFIGLATLPPALWGASERDAAAGCIAGIAARHIESRRAIWTAQNTSPKRTGLGRPA
jgi:transketolase